MSRRFFYPLVSLFALFVLAGLSARASSWSGPTAGEQVLSLDGVWRFTTDAQVVAQAGAKWDTLDVPGNWDVRPEYATHKGHGWYQREFEVPAEWPAESRVRLRFEAVYHESEVTLNGRVLGTHVGGYTPFEFDVTEVVKRGQPNVVTVRADNRYRRGAWWAWGGISRSVSLRANAEARLVFQHVRTEPDLASGAARVWLKWRVENAADRALEVVLEPSITALGLVLGPDVAERPVVVAKPVAAVLAARGVTEVTTSIDLTPEQVALWHFDQPNLYVAHTTLKAGERVLHARRDRFGIRVVELKADGMYLNGERIRVPGFNRVSDSSRTGNTEPDELVRKDVDLMKQSGAVFSRLMHSPQAPNLHDYLDEKGMMIIGEIPVWGHGDPQVVADNPLTKQWLAAMIERDYNHPSIIGWSTANEIEKNYDYVRTMNDYVRRELDPHRIVTYVSYTAFRGDYNPGNDGVTHSDLSMLNVYASDPQMFLNLIWKVRREWPEKPIFMSEFGVGQIGVGEAAVVPRFNEIWAALGKEPYVIGGAVWTFNDYRSDYHGTPESGNREWGVVDVDRNLKGAYHEVRRAFSPVRALTFEGRRIVVTPRAVNELPSYALRGYRLEWTARASEDAGVVAEAGGAGMLTGVIELPLIVPGAEVLVLEAPTELGSVRLVTPTGYAVTDGERVAE